MTPSYNIYRENIFKISFQNEKLFDCLIEWRVSMEDKGQRTKMRSKMREMKVIRSIEIGDDDERYEKEEDDVDGKIVE